jgi:hypothetical protein
VDRDLAGVELRPSRAMMCEGWVVKGSEERAGACVVKASEERGACTMKGSEERGASVH